MWPRMLALVLALAICSGARTSDEREGMLTAHAAVRATVGLPPLYWSDSLARHARQWAQYLIDSGEFRHEHNIPYGQNLYDITGGKAYAWTVVHSWADEAKDYNHFTNTCRSNHCGHYTQIVWKNTTSVGCANASAGLREVWVCDYSPPGNVVGQRPY